MAEVASINKELVHREKFRKIVDKFMRQKMVSRFQDRLGQLDMDRHVFKHDIGKVRRGGRAVKTSPASGGRNVNFSDVVTSSSGYDSDTDRSNVREESSISILGDDVAETMTQGNLKNRLNSLTGMGLLPNLAERVHSASGKGNKHGLKVEREKTFPGDKSKSRHTTALINWAVNMSTRSGTQGSDGGSLDSNPAVNFLMRRYAMPEDEVLREARNKVREKVNSSMSLPIDRLARISTLRQNVKFIEGKFKSMLYKQRSMAEAREEMKSAASGGATEDAYRPSRFTKQGEAVNFFRRRARMVIMVMRWINMIMDMNKNSSWEKQLKTFVDLAMDMEDNCLASAETNFEGSPAFDKNEFKANKEISLSMDVKTILSTRPEGRTPEMIKQVMIGLQTLQSLGEYPLDTQEQLCRFAWFQQVPARKYIIRQGHKPEAFYFILSGLAVVKKIELDEATREEHTRVVARLTRGQSFGELGLIFKTPRNATVESGTAMELLVVGKQDFLKIFMHNVKPGEDPDHIAFLKQQPVLKFWPFEKLKEDPSSCLINYFKRGTLVTESGKASEWIYFVKSGSCVALKRLKAVTPRSVKELRRLQHHKPKDNQLPEKSASRMSLSPRKQRRQSLHPELFRSITEYYDNVRTTAIEEASISKKTKKVTSGTIRRSSSLSSSHRPSMVIPQIIEPNPPNATGRQAYLRRTPPTEDINPYPLPPIPPQQSEGPGVSQSKFSHLSKWFGKGNLTVPTLTNLTNEYTEKDPSDTDATDSYRSRDDKEDVFVVVEKLQPRDIFGMNTISFSDEDGDKVSDDIPEVALVSKGAEIVMLSKKMFLKYADERDKLMVQELITPYPKEAQLQENLQIQADWNDYKQQVLSDVMFVNHALKRSFSGVV